MQAHGKSAVLIVGAGPAGAAAACVLARAGVDVCMLDRAQFPRDKTCGDAVSNEAMRLIEALGAGSEVAQAPTALVRASAAQFPDGSRVSRRYERPGYIVPRYQLDDALRRAAESAGAKLMQGQRVSALVRDEHGAVVGAEGSNLRWQAQLVIAADGYGSVGLAALGETQPRAEQLAISATGYFRNVRFERGVDIADHYFEPELPYGYGWIFPAVEGVSNVGVYMRSDAYARTGKKLRALFDAFLARHPERLSDAELVGEPRVWSLPIAPRTLPVSAPGLLLAGDAGGFIDPLSGEGIWQALHTGKLAGELAVKAIHQGSLTDTLRADYEARCLRDIDAPSRKKRWVQAGIEQIVQHGWYRSRAVRGALSLGYRGHLLEMTKS